MENGLTQLLALGLLMTSGLAAGLVASRFGIPRVGAYVVAGVIYSPAMLGGRLGIDINSWSEPVTAAALGIIAYLIGGSITTAQLRRMGKVILGCTLGQTLGAALVVALIMFLTAYLTNSPEPMKLALAFAVIAVTTAPAGTIAVLHQYRARGPVSSTLLGVVALDDMVGIILFSLMLTFVAGDSLTAGMGAAFYEIGGSLLLGGIGGKCLAWAGQHIRQGGLRLPMILGAIFLIIGFAERLHLSPLLSAMALGFTTRWSLRAAGERLFTPVDYFEEMVFIIFFTLAGAHFDHGIFLEHIGLVLLYVIARLLGKAAGTWGGAWLTDAPAATRRWLGLALVPQAGVAVGLALTLSHHPAYQEMSAILINVILAATLIHELIGPLAARYALQQAGEVGVEHMRTK